MTELKWRVVAASAQGTSHLQNDLPCQDVYGMRVLATGELLVAVADGAGSAAQGGMGAQLAVDHALSAVSEQLDKYRPTSPKAWRLLMTHAYAGARDALALHARQAGLDIRDYATTLLVAVLHPEGLACGLIGDAAAVVRSAEGVFYSPCPPQRGEYANATNFLVQSQALAVLDIQLRTDAVQQAAFFTDGLAPLAMNLAYNRPHPPFFEPLFAFLESTSDVESGAAALTNFLTSDRVNARTDDDKTLVLVQRL
ncbi:MAG: protein phosphatase 2C domain-containing protein [Caldilineaceae bacterium]|nr:protein phosphatase 2C domain-containing protein [Caldilineaceae bacterium]